jgi:hypothetical protein
MSSDGARPRDPGPDSHPESNLTAGEELPDRARGGLPPSDRPGVSRDDLQILLYRSMEILIDCRRLVEQARAIRGQREGLGGDSPPA